MTYIECSNINNQLPSSLDEGRNIKGGCHVQIKKKKDKKGSLRLVAQPFNKYAQEGERFNQFLSVLSLSSDSIRSIFEELTFNYSFLISLEFSPLQTWHKDLLSNTSLRKFTGELLESIKAYYNSCGIKMLSEKSFSSVYDEARLYNLGFSINTKEKHERKTITDYKVLIKNTDDVDKAILEISNSKNLLLLEKYALYSLALVHKARNQALDADLYNLVLKWQIDNSQSISSDNEAMFHLHILNSINFFNLKTKNYNEVLKTLSIIENLTKQIQNSKLQNHVLGNYYYQNALIASFQNNNKEELGFLKKSLQLDASYYDTHYRLACLYHDLGDKRAKGYYEKAISLSPCLTDIINDYGCFLDESNLNQELESLEEIASFLNLRVEDE